MDFVCASVVIFSFISSLGVAQECGVDFAFASYYQNNMVLQRAPTKATVWGYGYTVGEQVNVTIVVDGVTWTFSVLTSDGTAGKPVWSVALNPIDAGGPYNITARNANCEVTIFNVMFGDVWLCSGQSNMVFLLQNIDDPQEEIDDSVNYPDIRVFKNALANSSTPLEDLKSIANPWRVPAPDKIGTFSAICWLYGKNLYDKYQVPIGLIQTAWGGTRIEAWSSPAALAVCFPDGTEDREDQNEASVLYNAMIHPFLPMPIYGAIWYQGEANSYNPEYYGCAIQQMVVDWRKSWYANSPSMDQVFPFGEAQLAPNNPTNSSDYNRGFPNVRWAQSYQYGYTPNELLERFFMAVAMDTPDFESPHGSIHPRYKRQVADRLALAGMAVAYGDESSGIWQAPIPTAFAIQDSRLVITLGDGSVQVEARDTETSKHYEVCCATDPALVCEGEGDGTTNRWEMTTFQSLSANQVTVSMPCDLSVEFAVGVRYAWRESPCPNLEACAIHTVENGLPAPPFIYNGLIQ